ncbi:hypothetical protein [Xanthocytophaga agilis]|uniref:Outer membrane protein beta-barrel domain-containing protein n=1 Tax=Xanthocytophaga agilis TaxID=3048010 RepID=A0AAE3UG72_9BACT|nr:hypothetical protein [Xanthocytophaga agilis]MDJ1502996.1 hypothetical protein [Xanthocytophaga agilis]
MNTSKPLLLTVFMALLSVRIMAQMAASPEVAPFSSESANKKSAAENKFYVKAYGFYGLLTPGGFSGQGVDPSSTYSYSSGNGTTTYTTKSSDYKVDKSFGAGLRVGGGVGLVVNDFINIGIDGEYILGGTATESYTTTSEYRINSSEPTTSYIARVQKNYDYTIVNIIPNITFKAVSKPEYYIYNRLGVCIGIPTKLSYVNTSNFTYPDNPSARYEIEMTNELEKKVGFGYQAALGIQFRIVDQLRGFVELVISSVQLKSNSSEVTKAQYTYVDANTSQIDQPIEIDESQRRTDNLNLKIPVSSVGLGAGIAFRF